MRGFMYGLIVVIATTSWQLDSLFLTNIYIFVLVLKDLNSLLSAL